MLLGMESKSISLKSIYEYQFSTKNIKKFLLHPESRQHFYFNQDLNWRLLFDPTTLEVRKLQNSINSAM